MTQLADRYFDLSPQALAVLALLSEHEVDEAIQTSTFAFYNGRERSVGIRLQHMSAMDKALIIVWGECRNSDALFVDTWSLYGLHINPPTLADYTSAAYVGRQSFDYGRIDLAVKYIMGLVTSFCLSFKTAPKVP